MGIFAITSAASLVHILYSFYRVEYDSSVSPLPFGITPKERSANRRAYLQSSFLVDAVLAIPWDLFAILGGCASDVALYVSLFRLVRLTRLPSLVIRTPYRDEVLGLATKLFVVYTALAIHGFACLFIALHPECGTVTYIDGLFYGVGVFVLPPVYYHRADS